MAYKHVFVRVLTTIVYEGLGVTCIRKSLSYTLLNMAKCVRLASYKCMWKDCCYNDCEWIMLAVERRRRVHRYCSITV